MSNCEINQTCQQLLDMERRWNATMGELNKRFESVSTELDKLIERVSNIEKNDTHNRLTSIEKTVMEHLPNVQTLLLDLKTGQENIFKQLGKLDDHESRLTMLEGNWKTEEAAIIVAKNASWKSKWQVMFGSLLMSGLVASMIWDTSLRNWNNPVVIIVLCLGGAVFGAEFLRTWRELKGSVTPIK